MFRKGQRFMELANTILAFETYYTTWEKNPLVQPAEYFKTPGSGGPKADAKKAKTIIKTLNKLITQKKDLILKLGSLANRFGRLEVQPDSEPPIKEFKKAAKKLKGFSHDDVSATAVMIYYLNKNFDGSVFGATPVGTEAFYEATGTLLMFLRQEPLWK